MSVGRAAPLWLVGLAGLAIAVAVPMRTLVPNHMDPSIFLALGEESPAQTTFARRLLGEVSVRPAQGHDGKFFFVQANDPWYLRPAQSGALLDTPIYRAQRMLFPMLAGGLGLFPPGVIVWSMLVTNVIAMTVGAVLAAGLAASWELPTWLGLLVPLNIGLLFEFEIGGAGIVALTCCLGGLLALTKGRHTWASVFFAAAALARAEMLAFAVGVFVVVWLRERRFIWRLVVAPLIASGSWLAYLMVRLGISGFAGSRSAFALPFTGLLEAVETSWASDAWRMIANVTLLIVVVLFVPLAIRSRLLLAWGALPFAGMAIFLSADVWRETFDLARALAPVFTAAPFLVVSLDRAGSSVDQAPAEPDVAA